MDDALQALCFLAGANSIFYGDKPYIPQVEDAIWREFRCQSGGRNAPPARRVA
jgi:biotin synthase-like enzyme